MIVAIQPKEVHIKGITYVIHKIPATVAIEIMARGLGAATPNVGDYRTIESMMFKTMEYVAIRRKDLPDQFLISRELIDNLVPNYQVYLQVLEAISEYNSFFFLSGKPSDFLKNLIQTLPEKIIKMFHRLSPISSQSESPPSMS